MDSESSATVILQFHTQLSLYVIVPQKTVEITEMETDCKLTGLEFVSGPLAKILAFYCFLFFWKMDLQKKLHYFINEWSNGKVDNKDNMKKTFYIEALPGWGQMQFLKCFKHQFCSGRTSFLLFITTIRVQKANVLVHTLYSKCNHLCKED